MAVSKKAILAELQRLYPDAGPELHFTNPYETLVATMLSAQCTDKQVNKVTPEVFRRYPDAPTMAACTEEALYPLVKSCGFKSKAGNIIAACRIITQRFGGEVPSDMDDLLLLPGVGRKIANLIRGDVFGLPAIVADTHCIRIAGKLGFYPETCKDPRKTEKVLSELIAPEKQSDFCHRIVLLGRDCCTARSPECHRCPISAYCEHYGRSK